MPGCNAGSPNTTCQEFGRHDKGLRDYRQRQEAGWACLLGSLSPAGSAMLAWRPVRWLLLLCRLTQRALLQLLLLLLLMQLGVMRSSAVGRRTYRTWQSRVAS